ncbi:hypothetical protein OIU79_022907 [Salix purpurea]|uniref:Uncharacterized protein n=1 Tax=Salix purpurea TaxID=77065 RepID=A0A9Q0WJJ6_SALPP|nr:hypothetical protein OIU79_022907 [Salix purpurea]
MSHDTGVYRVHQSTAYSKKIEPACHLDTFDHAYHKQGQDVGDTSNDLLLLKFQAKWLEEKLEYFKDNSLSQEDLNRQTEDLRNIVNRAGRDQNNEILRKVDEEKVATQSDIRNIRIPGLEQLVRREDLKELEGQIDPRTLVRRTDLIQENILQQLEENNRIRKNFDVRDLEQISRGQTRELEEIRNEISRKMDRIPVDSSIERELEKAREQLRKISQLIGADSRRY